MMKYKRFLFYVFLFSPLAGGLYYFRLPLISACFKQVVRSYYHTTLDFQDLAYDSMSVTLSDVQVQGYPSLKKLTLFYKKESEFPYFSPSALFIEGLSLSFKGEPNFSFKGLPPFPVTIRGGTFFYDHPLGKTTGLWEAVLDKTLKVTFREVVFKGKAQFSSQGALEGTFKEDQLSLRGRFNGKLFRATVAGVFNLKTGHFNVQKNVQWESPKLLLDLLDCPQLSGTGEIFQKTKVDSQGNISSEFLLKDLQMKYQDFLFKKINGHLALKGWPDFTTEGPQTVTVGSAALPLPLKDLFFVVEGSNKHLLVKEAKGTFSGGNLWMDPFSIIDFAPPSTLALNVENLSLQELVNLSGIDTLKISGHLDGKMDLKWKDHAYDIHHEASFTVREKEGSIQYAFPEDFGEETSKIAFQVLKNFQYDALSLKMFSDPQGQWKVNIMTRGRNPDVLNAHPFEFNIQLAGQLKEISQELKKAIQQQDKK